MSSARDALTEAQWDDLLDGEAHLVELQDLRFTGGLSGFRSAVYREAEKRYGWAKTKRTGGTTVEVQGFDCRPDLARRHAASPKPYYSLSARPALQEQSPHTDAPLSEEETTAILGPCSCGASPQCLPTCSRFG